jgi:hypothetical protein
MTGGSFNTQHITQGASGNYAVQTASGVGNFAQTNQNN